MSEYTGKLRELLNLSEGALRALDTLDKIQSVVSYLVEKYFVCGDNQECEGLVKLVKRVKEWLRVYECVEKHGIPRMDLCLGGKSSVNFNTLELDKICIDSFECVYFDNLKLPLTDDSKKVILSKIKEHLLTLVDKIELSYSKTLLVIVEILRDIEHDLVQLREKYKKLHRKLGSARSGI